MPDYLMTVEELAELLHTTRAAIYAMQHRGTAPPSCRAGRRRLFPWSGVEAWIAAKVAEAS